MGNPEAEKAKLLNEGLGTWIFWGIVITVLIAAGWACLYGTFINAAFATQLPIYVYLPLLLPVIFPILYFTMGWAKNSLMPYRRLSELQGRIFVKTVWAFEVAVKTLDLVEVIPDERRADRAEEAGIVVELTFTEAGAAAYTNIKTGASVVKCEVVVVDNNSGKRVGTRYFQGVAPPASILGRRGGPVRGPVPDKEVKEYLKNLVLVTEN